MITSDKNQWQLMTNLNKQAEAEVVPSSSSVSVMLILVKLSK